MKTGLIAPSTNFAAVRDGRNSQVFYVDVALDSARSAAAGTALVLPISGNAFYCDANPGDGNAYVHFQDTNFDRGPVPLYVSPGVIFNIPFTQVLIENTAQPGKKIRIAYGIDIDFQPGSVAQIAVTNAGGYTAVRPEAPTDNFGNNGALLANTPLTIFTPAANVNGAIILSAALGNVNATGGDQVFIAKNAAPANILDGQVILQSLTSVNAGSWSGNAQLSIPQYIAPGLGFYFISNFATAAGAGNLRTSRYRLL